MKKWTDSPQLENGYVRIANELLEVLMAMPLTNREFKVMLGIVRITYGWNRKNAPLSQKNLAIMTGIDPTNLSKTIKALKAKNLIKVTDRKTVSVNKHYREWLVGDLSLSVEKVFIEGLEKRGLWNGDASGLHPADWVRLARWAGEVGMDVFLDAVQTKNGRGVKSLAFFFANTHGSCIFERAYFREKERQWEMFKASEAKFTQPNGRENSSGKLESSRELLQGLLEKVSSQE